MTTWILTNELDAEMEDEHFVFHNKENNQIAIADQSLRDRTDPASTCDGLLVWNGQPGIWSRDFSGLRINVAIDVLDAHGDQYRCTVNTKTAHTMEMASKLPVAPETIRFGPLTYKRVKR